MKLLFISIFLFISTLTRAQQTPAYYRYEGTLGARDAVMEIAVRPKETTEPEQEIEPITAYYYFKDDGTPLLLYKSKDNKGKYTVLRSWREDEQELFVVTYDEKELVGHWYWNESDEGEAIKLVGKQLADKDGFSFFRNHKVIKEALNPSNEPLLGTVAFSAFLPNDKKLQDAFIAFATEDEYKDFKQYSNTQITAFEKSYKDEIKQYLENGDAGYTESLNQFAIYNIYPVLNAEDYLIMMENVYSYSGGAHGMNIEHYYNYNKKTKKWISLYDLFDADKEAEIKKIMDKELRRQYQIPDGVKLSEASEGDFIADEVPINDNFTISKHDITFHFPPYVITPYAAGTFELKVPLENFKSILKKGILAN